MIKKKNNKSYSVGQCAKVLGVSMQTIRRWSNEGKIKHFLTQGGQRRFYQRELEKILGHEISEDIGMPEPKDGLSAKRNDIRALQLDISRERAEQTLKNLKGDPIDQEVKVARAKVELLRIEKERQGLMEIERRKHLEEEKNRKQEVYRKICIEAALDYFTFNSIFHTIPNELKIPLVWKVRLEKAITAALAGIELTTENKDEFVLIIRQVTDEVREEYCKQVLWPSLKQEAIKDTLNCLPIPKGFPIEREETLRAKVRQFMENRLDGSEDPEVVYAMAKEARKRALGSAIQ